MPPKCMRSTFPYAFVTVHLNAHNTSAAFNISKTHKLWKSAKKGDAFVVQMPQMRIYCVAVQLLEEWTEKLYVYMYVSLEEQ